MNYRKESGSREIRTPSPGLLTMIVKIRLKHVRVDAVLTGVILVDKMPDFLLLLLAQ